MKNIFLLSFMALFMFSCDTPVPAESEAERAPGFLNRGGEIFDATDANPRNLDLWDKYIDAHNNRDLETIREMNADSTETMGAFRIYDPAGGVVDNPDAHIERLSGWFAAEDPKWNTFFSYTMKVDGQVGEWVISGHTLTTTVDGEEKTVYDIADVYIEDGKIGAFWIYTRASASQ
jgi:hypothetical protein